MPKPTQRYENRNHYRGKHHCPQQNRQQKQKVTVPFLAIFMPRFDDYCAVPDDAVCKNKSATRLQPRDQDNESENKQREESYRYLQPGLPGFQIRKLQIWIRSMRLNVSQRSRNIEPNPGKQP